MTSLNSFAALSDLGESIEVVEPVSRSKKAKSGSKHNFSDGIQNNLRHNGDAESSAAESEQRQDPGNKYLKNPIVWIDLEMTGLDPESDKILEIAVLITDGELTAPHLEGPGLAIHQPDSVLNSMNAWCTDTHNKSGLTNRCRESNVSLEEAETKVLTFMQQFTESMEVKGSAQHKAHLAGNSVYTDHAFLRKHMPRIFAHLHWRIIDISTILELARRWFPEEFKKAPKKKVLHTAMADIRESLKELKFYRKHIFKQPGVSYREYLSSTAGPNT